MMSSPKLKANIAIASADLAKAQAEVAQLLQELYAGTLNRSTLQTGLQNLQDYVNQLSAHVPTFTS
jgi:hypothetical protein